MRDMENPYQSPADAALSPLAAPIRSRLLFPAIACGILAVSAGGYSAFWFIYAAWMSTRGPAGRGVAWETSKAGVVLGSIAVIALGLATAMITWTRAKPLPKS